MQRHSPKLIYTIPTHHNPTGVNMSIERRKHLIKLASRFKVLVLEDDAYGELCYEGQSLPSLNSMDNSGFIIYLSTFSKILYPGFRIGWMMAHKTLIRRLASARKVMDLHTNSLSQKIIEYFISGKYYEEQLKRVCINCKNKRDKMLNALDQYAPIGLTWTKPTGGYYIWCKLPGGIDTSQLLSQSIEQGVSFISGAPFFVSSQKQDYLRLNFTYASESDITKGVKILCKLISESLKSKHKVKLESEIYPFI